MSYQSENIDQLITALAKAQAEIKPAIKDKKNHQSTYASLNSVWDSCRGPISANGLAVSQLMVPQGEQLMLITILGHSSGQWLKSTVPLISIKSTPQALGSAITYMRRYSQVSILGITPDEDDDGVEANKHEINLPPDVKKPNPTQVKEIQSIISQCTPAFIKWISGEMQQMNTTYENMPLEWFNTLKETARKNMLEHQKVKKVEDVK